MPVLDGDFEAFVTNLGKYNEGMLVGEWVKFPTTEEEMQKVFSRVMYLSKCDCPIFVRTAISGLSMQAELSMYPGCTPPTSCTHHSCFGVSFWMFLSMAPWLFDMGL